MKKNLLLLSIIALIPSAAFAQPDPALAEALNKLPGTKPVHVPIDTETRKKFDEITKQDVFSQEGLIRTATQKTSLGIGSTQENVRTSIDAQYDLSRAYISSARSTKQIIPIIADNLGEFYRKTALASSSISAVQVSQLANEANLRFSALNAAQNQRIVEQNDTLIEQNKEIISLLKQQLKLKK